MDKSIKRDLEFWKSFEDKEKQATQEKHKKMFKDMLLAVHMMFTIIMCAMTFVIVLFSSMVLIITGRTELALMNIVVGFVNVVVWAILYTSAFMRRATGKGVDL